MTEPFAWTAITLASLAALVIVTAAALKGWHEWIELQRLSLQGRGGAEGSPLPAARIELADLRERVRKLEAIATGVDL
ncbi:hypothetical protein [uncultured Sphingomonas sp.]|uniref:hypothetical protein n=1 Tax=uncultured Sphingomonas sp. TaxID=158754 RepID=UPI0025D77FDC|nr:hypothetical protein [uncultured Sphingomonas sp.]